MTSDQLRAMCVNPFGSAANKVLADTSLLDVEFDNEKRIDYASQFFFNTTDDMMLVIICSRNPSIFSKTFSGISTDDKSKFLVAVNTDIKNYL